VAGKWLLRRSSLALVSLIGLCTSGIAADLVVGMPNWPSGQASANIIKYGIEKELGLDVDVQEMGTLIIFAGLDSGQVDIHPEVWQPNLDTVVKKYVEERKSVQLSPKKVTATQGLCATRETAEKFGIKTVADLSNPEKSSVLDTDGDGHGEVWIGAETWSSTPIERIRANSYGYAESVTLLEMPEEVAMAAVDAAAATNAPIVFYCYSPHHVFNLHDVVHLTEPEHDPAKWNIVLPGDDPAGWLSKSSAPVSWAPSYFQIAFGTKTAERLPKVASFLSNIDFTPEEITEMSYALEVERQDPATYAQKWVSEHEDRLEAWSK
jgi:glycine betaine/proline transport system substrate-binding protein